MNSMDNSAIASNSIYAGIETGKAVYTGDYRNVSTKGINTARSLGTNALTNAAAQSGVPSYFVGYANDLVNVLINKLTSKDDLISYKYKPRQKDKQISSYKYQPCPNDSTGYRNIRDFIDHIGKYGVLLQNNFEVEFDGIDNLTFFITNIELPGSKQNTCDIYYDGIKITIPVVYDHDHEFTMTIMNDANGLIYSVIKGFIELDSYNRHTDTGLNMRIKAFTGQIDSSLTGLKNDIQGKILYCGSVIVARSVRFTSIGGLTYGQGNNDILTFQVQGTLIDYIHVPEVCS